MFDSSSTSVEPPPLLDWNAYPDASERGGGYVPEGDYTLRVPDEETTGTFEIREFEDRPPHLITSLFVVAPIHAGHEIKFQRFDTALYKSGDREGKASKASDLARAAGSPLTPNSPQFKQAFRALLGRIVSGAHVIIRTRAKDETGTYRNFDEDDFPKDPTTGRLLPIRKLGDVELAKPIYPRNEVAYFRSRNSTSAPF